AWCAYGVTGWAVYFPMFLDGELPEPFTPVGHPSAAEDLWRRALRLHAQSSRDPEHRDLVRESLARLQAHFDQGAEEFNAEGAALKQRGALADVQRQATLFMQYNLERFESVLDDCLRQRSLVAADR